MTLIDKYLQHQGFSVDGKYEPNYQLLTWTESTLVAGFQTVDIPLTPSNDVLYIRIEQIAISTDGLGGTVSFRDKRMVTNLFTINNNVSYFTVTKFEYLINNTSWQLISNSATVLFALGYCFISRIEKQKK